MTPNALLRACTCAALAAAAIGTASAQNNGDKPAPPAASALTGSASFCLFELPSKDGTTRFVNLGIVQYVELNRERVRLTYGGGNFGSGFDADIPVKSREEGLDVIKRAQQTARECARHPAPGTANGAAIGNGQSRAAPAPVAAPATSNGGDVAPAPANGR